MRRMLPLYVLAIFVTTLAAHEARQSGSTDASVAAVIAQYNRGLNGGDLNAVIAAFHSDGVFMAPNQPPVSGDALRQWYANYWTRTVAKLQFTPASIRVEGALSFAAAPMAPGRSPITS